MTTAALIVAMAGCSACLVRWPMRGGPRCPAALAQAAFGAGCSAPRRAAWTAFAAASARRLRRDAPFLTG